MKIFRKAIEKIEYHFIDILKNNQALYQKFLKWNASRNKLIIDKIRLGNIVMLHNGRVGSTVVGNLLNQNTNIQWDGELFYNKNYLTVNYTNDKFEFLQLRKYQNKTKFYGFEIKAMSNQHLGAENFNLDITSFIKKMQSIEFHYFILIRRKNYLKQLVSFERAKQLKILHKTKDIKRAAKIMVNVNHAQVNKIKDSLINNFERIDQYYQSVEKMLNCLNHLILVYENDIQENPLDAYEKICQFLNIETQSPKIKFKRTNPFKLRDVIENYIEVESHLKGSIYEWMLYD